MGGVNATEEAEVAMKKRLQKLLYRARRTSAQSLVEYAIILAFIAVVAVLMLRGIGAQTNSALEPVNNAFVE